MPPHSSLAKYIKSYNLKELAALYEETPKTLRAWLRPYDALIGRQVGKKFTPRQVRIIFKKLDPPAKISELLDGDL